MRPGDQLGDVFLAHARADDGLGGLAGLLFHLLRFGGELRKRGDHVGLAQFGDLGQRLADVVGVRVELRHPEPVGRRDLVECFGNRVAVRIVTLGQQHHDRRLPVLVGINVGRDVDARSARGIELCDQRIGRAPEALHREFQVRHLHRHAGLAAEQDDLVDRVLEPTVLAPDVADIATPGVRCDLCQRQHLGRVRVDAGFVLEARGEPERAGAELLLQQRRHFCHLRRGGHAPEILAHDEVAQRVVAGIGRDVDGGRRRFELGEELRERVRRAAVLADDHGRDALAHDRQRVRVREDVVVGVAVGVDEPGREHLPLAVDDRVARAARDGADGRDDAVRDPDGTRERGRTRTIDDGNVGNDQPGSGTGRRFVTAACGQHRHGEHRQRGMSDSHRSPLVQRHPV